MNPPIRCEPLLFSGMTEKAAGEARPCTGEASEANFGEVLDAELEDATRDRTRAEKKRRAEADALAAYGAATAAIQVPPQPVETATTTANTEAADDPGNISPPANSSKLQAEIHRPNSTETAADPAGEEQAAAADVKQIPALPRTIPAEQKLPLTPPVSKSMLEQIASNLPEPAKIARGMVAAQAPPMLLPSPQKEEKTQSLGIERFETTSFEQPIRLENFRRETVPARQLNPEATTIDAFRPEMPTLEGMSGEVELQPMRPVEPTALVEAIRTHVELLKSSAADKLDVVLRPDAQTAIRLQVETVNGIIQVQARCERGDFALLDAHWGAIQNSLANQGVRVEPLQQGNGAQFQQNSQNFHDFQESLGRDSKQNSREEFFIEQDLAPLPQSRPKPNGTRGSMIRGWQSWA